MHLLKSATALLYIYIYIYVLIQEQYQEGHLFMWLSPSPMLCLSSEIVTTTMNWSWLTYFLFSFWFYHLYKYVLKQYNFFLSLNFIYYSRVSWFFNSTVVLYCYMTHQKFIYAFPISHFQVLLLWTALSDPSALLPEQKISYNPDHRLLSTPQASFCRFPSMTLAECYTNISYLLPGGTCAL